MLTDTFEKEFEKHIEDGPLTNVGQRGLLDPIQMSPFEKKLLDDRYGELPITKPGIGKQVLVKGSVAAIIKYLDNTNGFYFPVRQMIRKMESLSGFHASHDANFKPKNTLSFIPNDNLLNQYIPGTFQPKENRLPTNEGNKNERFVFKAKFRNGLYNIQSGDFKLTYAIYDEKVIVTDIEHSDKRLKQMDSREQNGLYHVIQDLNTSLWRIENKTHTINTRYAAVNGQSNNLNKAVWLMGEHLSYRYGKDAVKEYTLFHNKTYGGILDTVQSAVNKLAVTTRTARQLCTILQDCQARDHKVRWLGHSQGAIMLHEAVNWHISTDGRSRIGGLRKATSRRAKPLLKKAALMHGLDLDNDPVSKKSMEHHSSKAGPLDVHTVALHGAATNQAEVRKSFDEVGITFAADVSHPLDMVNSITGGNFLGLSDLVGSLMVMNHVFSGTVSQSTHTLPFKDFDIWLGRMGSGDSAMPDERGTGLSKRQRKFISKHKDELIKAANERNFCNVSSLID